MEEVRVPSLRREDPLEKEMATHSSILAWETPQTGEPGGLQSMGSQRVGHDLVTKQQPASTATVILPSNPKVSKHCLQRKSEPPFTTRPPRMESWEKKSGASGGLMLPRLLQSPRKDTHCIEPTPRGGAGRLPAAVTAERRG